MNTSNAVKKHNKKIGIYLKDARESANLTQKDVADICACKSQFVSNWERGTCLPPMPVMKRLVKICKINETQFVNFLLKEHEILVKSQLGIKK
jgi:transcriptional regulator with XRE-family HTH domain